MCRLERVINSPHIILGGTFDPIHNGHLLLAQKLYEVFKTPITFIPTAPPNYKSSPVSTANQRLEMLQLALNQDPRFILDTSEIFKLEYIPTIKSLTNLRSKIGNKVPIHFLIGGDSLITLDSWDNYQELFNLANFIVAMRPGYNLVNMSQALRNEYNNRLTCLTKFNQPSGQIYTLEFTPLAISSTLIRNNIQAQLSITNLVSPNVAKYIYENKLYFNKSFC